VPPPRGFKLDAADALHMLGDMNSVQPSDPASRATTLSPATRRRFLQSLGLGAAVLQIHPLARAQEKPIQGFEKAATDPNAAKGWQPVSDRKLRMGIVGYGVCKFGAEFGFQNHPNVEIVAVSDLIPDRCAELAKACRCAKTYPSLEELVKDDRIEAVFVATDAQATRGIARKCCATANMWSRPCPPCSDRWRTRRRCSRRSRPAAALT